MQFSGWNGLAFVVRMLRDSSDGTWILTKGRRAFFRYVDTVPVTTEEMNMVLYPLNGHMLVKQADVHGAVFRLE